MKNSEIKKILVPVDFTETAEIAIEEAMSLAVRLKADVHLLHVIESAKNPYLVFPEFQIEIPRDVDMQKMLEEKFYHMGSQLFKKFGIMPSTSITTGHVYTNIIDWSGDHHIDLIVMGTHGASGLKEMFIGSNAQRVVTHSTIPVLTMQQKNGESGFKNILIPIDDSFHSREKVNIAFVFAELYDSTIHVLGLSGSDDETDLKKIRIKVESIEKLCKSDELPCKTELVVGDNLASEAIKYSQSQHCDLIVINTGHESEISGTFLHPFAQQLVNHTHVPVLSYHHTEHHYTIDTPGFGI